MTFELNPAQAAAVETRGRDLCVEAGAGTGKTRVLTERIVRRVVEEGADLSRILAITFTEKAAQEMKARLAQALLDAGRKTAREDVEAAPISTVHAFCARLLRDHAVEAGIDPGFAVLDEVRADALVRDALSGLVREWAENRPDGIAALAALPGGDPEETLLEIYAAARDSGESVGAFVRRTPGGSDVEAALVDLRRALDVAAAARSDASATWAKHIDAALAAAGPLRESDASDFGAGDAEGARATAEFVVGVRGAFQLRGGAGLAKEAMSALRDACDAAASALADVCVAPLRETLAEALERLEELHRAAKGDGAALDFSDLERAALDLLESREDVRAAVRERYGEALVDEFQDTNPVQARLMELVRNPGGLFVVGDPKQSIYGFRGADVEVFLERVERVRAETGDEGSGLIALTESYRSRPQVTGFVNALFADGVSQDDDELGVRGVPYQPLVAPRSFPPKDAPCVEVLSFPAENATDARDREASWIADRIVELVSGDDALRVATTGDDGEPGERPATFGDVAVLLRATTHVKKLEQALIARDVPYLVVKGRGFYEAREVVDIANLLGVVDDPTHDIRLASVLRSPCCGVGDDTLHALTSARADLGDRRREPLIAPLRRFASGELRPVDLDVREGRLLRGLSALLDELRALRAVEPLAVLVDRALARTDLEAQVLAQRNGRQRAANLRKVREMALAADAAGDVSLEDFVRTLRELRQREVRETEAPVAGAAHGAVSILTVHAAKGLEFPIVFVPDLARAPASEGGALVSHVRDGLGLKGALPHGHPLEKIAPASHAWIKARNTARARAEEQRLFYVALTRAEEHLVLTAAIPASRSRAKRPWWDRVAPLVVPPDGADADTDDPDVDGSDGESPDAESPEGEGPRSFVSDVGPGADPAGEARATVLVHAPVPPAVGHGAGGAPSRIGRAAQALARHKPVGGDVSEAAEAIARERIAESARAEPPQIGTLYLTTVSAVVAFDRCPEEFRRRHVLGIPESLELALALDGEPGETPDVERAGDDEWGLELSTRALGRAAHLALERLAPEFADDVGSTVREALLTETGGAAPSPDDLARVEGWVRGFADSDLGRVLRTVPRAGVRREQAVLLRVGRTVVRGQIDLLFHDDTGWTLVDYKAGRLDTTRSAYALQMRLYALAMERVVGELPRRALLWSLPDAEAHPIDIGAEALRDLESGLLEDLQRRMRDEDYTPGPSRPCRPCAFADSCGLSLVRADGAPRQ